MGRDPEQLLDLSGDTPEIKDAPGGEKSQTPGLGVLGSKTRLPVLLPDALVFSGAFDTTDIETARAEAAKEIGCAVSDLAFYEEPRGEKTMLAAVAKKTLAEARDIAKPLGIIPSVYLGNAGEDLFSETPEFYLRSGEKPVWAIYAAAAAACIIAVFGLWTQLASTEHQATKTKTAAAVSSVAAPAPKPTSSFIVQASFSPQEAATAQTETVSVRSVVYGSSAPKRALAIAKPEQPRRAVPLRGTMVLPASELGLDIPLAPMQPRLPSLAPVDDTAPILLASLDVVSDRTFTEDGVRLLQRRPSILPPARGGRDTAVLIRPKPRPGSQTPAAVQTDAPLQENPVAETSEPETQEQAPAATTDKAETGTTPQPAPQETAAVSEPAPELAPLPAPPENAIRPKPRKSDTPDVATEADATIELDTAQSPVETEEPASTAIDLTKLAFAGHQGKLPKTRPSALNTSPQVDLAALAFRGHKGKTPKTRPRGLNAPKPIEQAKPEPVEQPEQPKPDPVLTQIQIAEDIRQREEAARLQNLRSASRLAVPISRVPARKPPSFSRTVAKTKANIRKAALSTPSERQPATEPSSTGRSSTTTFGKGKISLVGVYGTPSARRALIRTASGRYVKVKSGQRVSGWRVSAIGANTVRISKGSRTRTLRMP